MLKNKRKKGHEFRTRYKQQSKRGYIKILQRVRDWYKIAMSMLHLGHKN